jgi:predicted nucleic acid-binding protein
MRFARRIAIAGIRSRRIRWIRSRRSSCDVSRAFRVSAGSDPIDNKFLEPTVSGYAGAVSGDDGGLVRNLPGGIPVITFATYVYDAKQ